MSSHHDDHHSAEAKPVAFTVPFILAAVTLIIIFLFVSMCDPMHSHHPEGEAVHHSSAESGHGAAATSHEGHHDAAPEAQAAANDTIRPDVAPEIPPAVAPEVEGKPAESAHH